MVEREIQYEPIELVLQVRLHRVDLVGVTSQELEVADNLVFLGRGVLQLLTEAVHDGENTLWLAVAEEEQDTILGAVRVRTLLVHAF